MKGTGAPLSWACPAPSSSIHPGGHACGPLLRSCHQPRFSPGGPGPPCQAQPARQPGLRPHRSPGNGPKTLDLRAPTPSSLPSCRGSRQWGFRAGIAARLERGPSASLWVEGGDWPDQMVLRGQRGPQCGGQAARGTGWAPEPAGPARHMPSAEVPAPRVEVAFFPGEAALAGPLRSSCGPGLSSGPGARRAAPPCSCPGPARAAG